MVFQSILLIEASWPSQTFDMQLLDAEE